MSVLSVLFTVIPENWFIEHPPFAEPIEETSGAVRNGNTGRPIGGATVTFRIGNFSRTVSTDSQGVYRLPLPSKVSSGNGRIIVEKDGYEVYDKHIHISPHLEEIPLKPISSRPAEPEHRSEPPPSSISPQTRGNYSFALQSCRKNGTSIECSLMIRNNGQRDKYFIWGSSRILDNLSNEIMISRASIGSKNRNMRRHSSLANDIPLRGEMLVSLHFDGVNPEVNRIKTLEIVSRGEIGVVTFNDVPLSN